jgi:putative lipoic acid-binding regulatory protein
MAGGSGVLPITGIQCAVWCIDSFGFIAGIAGEEGVHGIPVNGREVIMKENIIDYPCKWPYKIIGSDPVLIEEEISAKLDHLQFEMNISNQSKKGRYVSFQVEVYVADNDERMAVFDILKNISTVKIVF